MKITVEHCEIPENEVVLRCAELDDEMLRVLSLLKSGNQKICALITAEIRRINQKG